MPESPEKPNQVQPEVSQNPGPTPSAESSPAPTQPADPDSTKKADQQSEAHKNAALGCIFILGVLTLLGMVVFPKVKDYWQRPTAESPTPTQSAAGGPAITGQRGIAILSVGINNTGVITPSMLWATYGATYTAQAQSPVDLCPSSKDLGASLWVIIRFPGSLRGTKLSISENKYLDSTTIVATEEGDKGNGMFMPRLLWKRDALMKNPGTDRVKLVYSVEFPDGTSQVSERALLVESRNVVVWPTKSAVQELDVATVSKSHLDAWATYVNEDDPVVQDILMRAKQQPDRPPRTPQPLFYKPSDRLWGEAENKPVTLMDASLAAAGKVRQVWQAIRAAGVTYSNITPHQSQEGLLLLGLASQWVRTPRESWQRAQANCVDGSVLVASVLRKLGIPSYLMLVPGHMFVGFDLEVPTHGTVRLFLETTANADFEDAVRLGSLQAEKFRDQTQVINIEAARIRGARPLPEFASE